MKSAKDKIEARIRKRGGGRVVFAGDFADVAAPDAVNKSLYRLAKEGTLIQCARGIYFFPKKDKLPPDLNNIAKAIAKRDKARIVPTGAYALNALGLSTQVPMNVVYLTDGAARKISVGDGRGITLKHTAPKNLAYTSDLMMLVVSAMKEIGEGQLTETESDKISSLLKQYEVKDNILRDIRLAPAWIREIILKMILI